MDKITEEIEKFLAKIKTNALRGVIIVGVILGLVMLHIYGFIYVLSMLFSSINKNEDASGRGAIGYSSISYTDEDIQYLAALMMNERGEEATDEQWSYIASVVLNRVLVNSWVYNRGGENTIKGIIIAPYQFSGVNNGERWANEFAAVGNWMTTGHSGSIERSDEICERAVNQCYSVLENGDTTGTASHPEGGATTFAGASIVRTWLAGSWGAEGWYGLFNDADENCKSVETNGEHWKNDDEYGSLSYIALPSDVEKLEPYRMAGGLAATTGGITTDAEAEALEVELTNMLNTVIHSKYTGNGWIKQDGPFPVYWSGDAIPTGGQNTLQKFQCTWWVWGRATQYLAENGTVWRYYPTTSGHGKDYFGNNRWFESGQEPRANSIVSWWGPYTQWGHVAYVEGVNTETQTVYYSHAGGGHAWNGISSASIEEMRTMNGGLVGYVYLDSPLASSR